MFDFGDGESIEMKSPVSILNALFSVTSRVFNRFSWHN
jgi:hypothetical protein